MMTSNKHGTYSAIYVKDRVVNVQNEKHHNIRHSNLTSQERCFVSIIYLLIYVIGGG